MSGKLQLNTTEYRTFGQKVQKSKTGVLNVFQDRKSRENTYQNSFLLQQHKILEKERGIRIMTFFTTAVTGLKTVVTAIGAGVGVWGVINLLEGYGNDNPGANAHVR